MTLREKIARQIDDEIWHRGPTWRLAQDRALVKADRILALLAESGWRHVPDDCVVVPREPTPDMMLAGGMCDAMQEVGRLIRFAVAAGGAFSNASVNDPPLAQAYRAMLAAASKPKP